MKKEFNMQNRSIIKLVLTIFLIIVCFISFALAADGPGWIGAFFVKGKVGLKWKAIDGSTDYKIYRAADGGEFTVLTTTSKTQYFDSDITSGTVYHYKIAAVTSSGELMSTDKSITIPGAKAGAFQAPIWVGLRLDRNKIFLNWDNVGGAMAYNIYRSATAGGEYELVGSSQASKYADKEGMTKGETYYYVLTALNEEFEETQYSEERSIKFGFSMDEQKALEAAANNIVLEDIKLTFLFDIKTAGSLGDMNQPSDVVVDSKGNIFIADALNQKIHCFDNNGKFLFSFGEKTKSGKEDIASDGTFSLPMSMTIDKSDLIYVGDVTNHDIQVFSNDGKFVKRIRINTTPDQEKFRPNGIAVLDDGNLLVTDAGNHRFMKIDQNGKILFEVGKRGSEDSQFIFPDGISVSKDNIISVVDVINCRIQQFDINGKFIRKFGEPGQSAGTFGRPKAIIENIDGRLWISDGLGNIVQVFTPEGEVKAAITTFDDTDNILLTPRGMFIKDGRFYVINRVPHQLLVFKIG